MKKKLFTIVLCVCSVCSFAQLKVLSSGYVNSNNITADGVMGVGSSGVLTVTSNKRHPSYDSRTDMYGLGLIRTKCVIDGIYPYSNLLNNRLNFYVRSDGRVYATGLILPEATAALNRSAVSAASSVLVSPLAKLRSLHGVVYQEVAETGTANQNGEESVEANRSEKQAMFLDKEEISRQMELEKSRKRIGLLASEVEQIFPDAVRTLPDGSKGILYSDLVAILIESVKELQDSLTMLKAQINGERVYRLPAGQGETVAYSKFQGQEEAVLYQNTPNPFNRETEIAYRLREDAVSAFICIYNLNGQQLKKYPVSTASLTGKLTVSASEFQPGMYIYTLIIDNEMADSKRMTLTD